MDTINLRPARPIEPLISVSNISFKHPGYESRSDVLFWLPRLDDGGVHHGTALLACQIVADNAFDGYLTIDRDGQHRVSTALDGVLRAESYWFVVPGQEAGDAYPVVPRFEDWRFPHDYMSSLPAWTSRSQHVPESQNVSESQEASAESLPMAPPLLPASSSIARCILSSKVGGSTNAHIVPVAQNEWFLGNGMVVYSDEVLKTVHDKRNIVRMRQDLHSHWDAYHFALVPKPRGDTHVFVAHALKASRPDEAEFANDWHNTPVRDCALDGTAKAFLFAKFAQAVLMLFKPFVSTAAVSRKLTTLEARVDGDPRNPVEKSTAWMSPFDLHQRYGGGVTRSASASTNSRKRSRSQMSNAANDSEFDEEEDTRWYRINVLGREFDDDDIQERGRPRTRRRIGEWIDQTVDTLPSLTDTSATADLEDNEQSGVLRTSSQDRSVAQDEKLALIDGQKPGFEDKAVIEGKKAEIDDAALVRV